MSTLTRSAKLGRSWTPEDLLAFNIQVVLEDSRTFFGVADLPTPNVSPMVWDYIEPSEDPEEVRSNWSAGRFFFYLEEVGNRPGEVAAVGDFVRFLLQASGFESMKGVIIWPGTKIPFVMCGKDVSVKPDITIIEPSEVKKYLLLVKLAKRKPPQSHLEPQLIASAIAAFSANNFKRRNAGLSEFESQTLLGIIVVGTTPEFYKIVITQELVSAVEVGQYPLQPTIVKKLLPPLSDLTEYNSQGMVPLENRRFSLKCFTAFQKVLDDLN